MIHDKTYAKFVIMFKISLYIHIINKLYLRSEILKYFDLHTKFDYFYLLENIVKQGNNRLN